MLSFLRQLVKGIFAGIISEAWTFGDPHFSCISNTSNPLPDHSKSLKKIYVLEDIRANFLKENF